MPQGERQYTNVDESNRISQPHPKPTQRNLQQAHREIRKRVGVKGRSLRRAVVGRRGRGLVGVGVRVRLGVGRVGVGEVRERAL